MASDFVGYTVLVTLQNPPNAQIQGVVADVINQKLLLQNGMVFIFVLKPLLSFPSLTAVEWPATPILRH